MKRLFPLILTMAAGALGAAGPAQAPSAAEIPPIDRAVPERIETATFALG